MKKRILLSILSGLLTGALFLSGCAQQETSTSQSSDGQEQESVIKIGIIQQVEHQSLDDIYQGIVDGLEQEGYIDGENIEINYLNGQGNQANLKTISQQLVNDGSNLIIGIATGAAQSAASETQDIPILAAAITDLQAAALVDSNEAPGGNVTGISDMTPISEQLDLLFQLAPDTQTVGLAYCSNEPNSAVQIEAAKEYLEEKGISYEEVTAINTNDIAQALTSLVDRVDAVYIPVDNTFASAMPTVMNICGQKNLPVITGAAAMVEEGALGTVAFDYYDVGLQCAQMAIRLFNGGDPATMPVEFVKDTKLTLNKTYAEQIGITIPDTLLEEASAVF